MLAGETDLLTLAATIAHARLLLCGDTGLAHLATAFGTPSVVLFGPTPPARWGPPVNRVDTACCGPAERAIRTLPCRIAACSRSPPRTSCALCPSTRG